MGGPDTVSQAESEMFISPSRELFLFKSGKII